jgi:squalene-hopene/tetraprenyl-beta-curcumene cyclase
MAPPDDDLATLHADARRRLLAARDESGHWTGELSSSALSTATALFTLSLHDRATGRADHADLVRGGLRWLTETQNADGGWGDTTRSLSNISTTALCWAAFGVPEVAGVSEVVGRAEAWLRAEAGSLDPAALARTIADRYGRDRTFSVPIVTMLALAGRLGPRGWRLVPQLPFELATVPFRWFQWLRMPVVSYALPALIAIGHARHHARPTWNPALRLVRRLVHGRTLRKLRAIQPTTGGYLEATPLTSFVAMSLIGAGQFDSPVVAEGVRFLRQSVRPDGSWPIDTNLATWVTTLSVNALLAGPDDDPADFPTADRARVRAWLLGQQYRAVHPYTQAPPGGWAWTDLPGGVPDADDTAGVLLALARLGPADGETLAAAAAGVGWLLGLQNADGGVPTFCRGWTGLPFDRSSADITAHALLAWTTWLDRLDAALRTRTDAAARRAVAYLLRTQRPDGSWAPLWFGNQHSDEVANLTYGTSRVLRLAAAGDRHAAAWPEAMSRAAAWLRANQNPDGGWGGRAGTPSSVEETSLALEGLAAGAGERCGESIERGVAWLAGQTPPDPTPIGFYFANLWYFEKLYPTIYLTGATTVRGGV